MNRPTTLRKLASLVALLIVTLLIGPLASWAQELEPSASLTIAAVTEVICDNKDACFSKYESDGAGSWGYVQPGNGDSSTAYNQHAFWTYNAQNRAIDWGKWQPSLPSAGTYDVYVWYPHYPGSVPETNNARYQVHDASGDRSFTWNQATSYGGWIRLTSASCVAGASCYVRLTDETTESTGTRRVWFDAVKFVLQAEPVFTVSGRILNSVGTGLAGVTVTDGTRTATTDSSGAYTLSGVPAGGYTLTPSLSGYTFSPSSLSVSVSSSNLSGRNFTATQIPAATYSISGRVSINTGAGLGGVTISDGTRTATTDGSGAYTLSGVPAGSYTLTPSLAGYSFSPSSRSVAVSGNLSGQDFARNASPMQWTLLIYAAADNNLDAWMGDNPTTNGMLHRLAKAGPQAGVQVAVLYDGPGKNDTRRYLLNSAGAWSVEPLPEVSMDAQETLRDFVQWGYTALPASDHYALAIVDHANGVIGIAQDETSKSKEKPLPFLTPLQVRAALLAATNNGERQLDVLHYDACSFGLFENAASADGLARYVIASPNTAWGIFAYERYRQLAGASPDPRTYALRVAQHYAEAVDAYEMPYTVTVMDMANFASLNDAISRLGDALLAYVKLAPGERISDLSKLRATLQKYDSGQGYPMEPDNEDEYVDLVHLATGLKAQITDVGVQTAADQVIAQALPANQRFVIFESHVGRSFLYLDAIQGGERLYNVKFDHAHGLGIYYPPRSSGKEGTAYMNYIQHRLFHTTRDSGWARFLAQGLPPQRLGDPAALTDNLLIAPFLLPAQPAASQIFLPLMVR